MAAIEDEARTYLLTINGITSLVGARIYEGTAPQKNTALPFVVYNVVSDISAVHLGNGADFAEARIQYDVYGATPASRAQVFEAIRNALHGYKGSMGSTTVDSVVMKNRTNLFIRPEDSSDTGTRRATVDYYFRYQQSTPTHA